MWTEILFIDGLLPIPPPLPAAAQGMAGAWAEFRGYVRADEHGQKISALRYDIYEPMASKQLAAHIAELAGAHGLAAVRFWHRTGVVPVGEAAVYVGIAAPHRREALAALAELMDRLKKDVPIWKAEALPA